MVLSIPDESCPESSFRALQGLACLVIALRLGWNRNRLLPSPYRSHSSLHRDRHLFSKLVTAAPTLTPIIYTRVEYLEIIPKLKKKKSTPGEASLSAQEESLEQLMMQRMRSAAVSQPPLHTTSHRLAVFGALLNEKQ